jgi:hypothetical protein
MMAGLEPKQTPVSVLRAEAQVLLESGKMPSFGQVLVAVMDAQDKFKQQILDARKEFE